MGTDGNGGPATPDDAECEPPPEPAPVVEYCVNNLPSPDQEALEAVGIEARGMPCLERCGTCRTTPFLVVEGELYTAASHEHLRETLPGVGP